MWCRWIGNCCVDLRQTSSIGYPSPRILHNKQILHDKSVETKIDCGLRHNLTETD